MLEAEVRPQGIERYKDIDRRLKARDFVRISAAGIAWGRTPKPK